MLHFRRQTWRKSLIVFNSFKCYQKHPVPARYITIWREIWNTDIVIKNLGKCMHWVCQDNTCNPFLSIHELLIGPQHVNIGNVLLSQNNAVCVYVGACKKQSAKTNLIMTYLQCSDVFESHNCHTLIYYVMSRSIHRYVALCLVLMGTHKSTHPNQNQNKKQTTYNSTILKIKNPNPSWVGSFLLLNILIFSLVFSHRKIGEACLFKN